MSDRALAAEPATRARVPGLAARSPWLSYALRRAGRLVVSMWILVTASFFMIHLIPGDPVRSALGKYASADLVQADRKALGLDRPIFVQYVQYLKHLATGD